MSQEYQFFYIESMVVCVIIFGLLLMHDILKGDRQERQIRYDNVLMAHMLYFIADGFWSSIISGVLPHTGFSMLLINFFLMVFMGLVGSTWFVFVAATVGMPHRNTPRGKLLMQLPMLISVTVVGAGMLLRPGLWIDGRLEMTDLFNAFFIGTPVIYVFCSFLYSMYEARKKENLLNRRRYLFVGIYPVTVVIAGVIQTLFLNAPIFCFSCTIMMILFYILSQDEQISVDPLTKLNNRGQLMRFAAQESSLHKEGLRTYLLMSDVNEFKKINDTFGHAEGDRALVMVADALRHGAEQAIIPPFLGRYGGDEFILIVYGTTEAEPRQMIQRVREDLAARCTAQRLAYRVGLGFGFEELQEEDSFQTCLERADQKLYQDKMARKQSQRPQ